MRITKIGIPPGGSINQVLVKSSGTDYDVEWGTGSGTATPPGGLNTQVQFNDGGVFGGDSGFTYNKTTNRLTLGSLVLNDVVDPGVDTDKFLVLTSLGVVSYRNGASVLVDIGGVPTSRTLTINGTSYDLSANRSWSVGTVTSVGLSVPTGFSVANSPVIGLGTLALSFASGYSLPTNASQTNWDTAYTNRITSLTTTGSSGAATLISNTLNIPNYTLAGLGGVPTGRTITINGTAQDLSADRTYSVGTVESVAALTLGTTGTDLSSSVANGTTTPVITLNVPTASAANRGALSSADWSTFNGKENALTFSSPLSRSTNTISIPAATGSVNGYLTSTDWTTFNGKQNALNGTGFVKISGTTISYDNSTYYLASNPNGYTSNVGTVTSIATSAPITGGTITGSGTIGITQASGSSDGYLSSTDWTTFNNKQNALTNPVTGTGTTNYIPKWTSSSAIGNSNLINDASGNLGLGVTPSAWDGTLIKAIQIGDNNGSISSFTTGNTSTDYLFLNNNAYYDSGGWKYISTNTASQYVLVSNEHRWYNAPSGTAGNAITFTPAMTLDASGNLGVNATPSSWVSTWKVIQGNSAGSFGVASANNGMYVMSNAYYNTSGNPIYTASSFATMYQQINGGHFWYYAGSGTAGNAISFTQAMTLDASGNLVIGDTTAGSKLDVNGTIRISTTGRIEGRAFPYTTVLGSGADATTTYIDAGSTSGFKSQIVLAGGGATNPNTIKFYTASVKQLELTANGDLIIGSGADTGESLQVQGDLKVSMNTTNPVATFTNLNTAGTGNGVLIQLNSVLGSDNYILKLVSNAADRFILKENGQLRLNDYTTTTSFSGTPVGYLAFENDGDVITRSPAQVLSDIGAQASLTNAVTGTGTQNLVAKFTANGSAIGNSSIIDNGTTVELQQGQLKFPATQYPSSDANTLDDYEEGDWTPIYEPQLNSFTTITYSSARSGRYQKIGRKVHITGYIATDSLTIGTGSGSLRIGGLPFTHLTTPESAIPTFVFTRVLSWDSTGSPPSMGSTFGLTAGTKFVLHEQRDLQTSTTVNCVPGDMITGSNSEANRAHFFGSYDV